MMDFFTKMKKDRADAKLEIAADCLDSVKSRQDMQKAEIEISKDQIKKIESSYIAIPLDQQLELEAKFAELQSERDTLNLFVDEWYRYFDLRIRLQAILKTLTIHYNREAYSLINKIIPAKRLREYINDPEKVDRIYSIILGMYNKMSKQKLVREELKKQYNAAMQSQRNVANFIAANRITDNEMSTNALAERIRLENETKEKNNIDSYTNTTPNTNTNNMNKY